MRWWALGVAAAWLAYALFGPSVAAVWRHRRNIPGRVWLMWHLRHRAQNLVGPMWTCSCGSTHPATTPDHPAAGKSDGPSRQGDDHE